MPRMFIKLEDKEKDQTYYFEWSTISDSINSKIANGFGAFFFMYNTLSYTDFEGDLKRLKETGVSNPHYTLDELLECSDDFNTVEELLEYCRTVLN